MIVVVLCADSDQVDIVNTRVSGVLADTDALCRKAIARISTANIIPATPPTVRPKKYLSGPCTTKTSVYGPAR